MDLESAAASLLRQWRGNSGIVEAFAEHDSRFHGFIGMFCRGEPEYIYLEIRLFNGIE